MRDIYIEKRELKLKYNPKDTNQLLPFTHPELLLNSTIKFLKLPDDYINSMNTDISSIVCKVLITNYEHDGIWLTKEDDKNKVSIPGGHVSEYELLSIKEDKPYTAIYETLLRELVEENPMLRDMMFYEGSNVMDDLDFVIKEYGFTSSKGSAQFPLMYSYDDMRGSFIIYMVKEVDIPTYNVPPLFCEEMRNMIWYSRRDHNINKKTSMNRRNLFGSAYSNDTRLSTSGVAFLDRIFSTESIFGKLNIY